MNSEEIAWPLSFIEKKIHIESFYHYKIFAYAKSLYINESIAIHRFLHFFLHQRSATWCEYLLFFRSSTGKIFTLIPHRLVFYILSKFIALVSGISNFCCYWTANNQQVEEKSVAFRYNNSNNNNNKNKTKNKEAFLMGASLLLLSVLYNLELGHYNLKDTKKIVMNWKNINVSICVYNINRRQSWWLILSLYLRSLRRDCCCCCCQTKPLLKTDWLRLVCDTLCIWGQ